jgi:hypothetical protein
VTVGQLTIDNRASGGKLYEADTVLCKHCAKIIAVIVGPVKEYQGKRRCNRCDGAICRICAMIGGCNPYEARVEHAIKTGGWDESFQHQYKILPN